jgi:hypothetical protein
MAWIALKEKEAIPLFKEIRDIVKTTCKSTLFSFYHCRSDKCAICQVKNLCKLSSRINNKNF